jgi:hypothetical protein
MELLKMSRLAYDEHAEEFARCRAFVLQAVNKKPGMTYPEIRAWILKNKHFEMEDVGRRVRELARERTVPLVRIDYDKRGHAIVYPAKEEDGA